MKRATCYLILAMLLLLGGCQPKTEMSYNPYVEAFTTGTISRFAQPTLILTDDLSRDSLQNWEAAFQLRPAVAGEWKFDGRRTFQFQPKGTLERNQSYTLTVDLCQIIPVQDKQYETFSCQFETAPLSFRADWESLDINPDDSEPYNISCAIYTADRESPELVEALIGASEEGTISWQHAMDGKRHVLTLGGLPAGEREVSIQVLPNKEGVAEENLLQVAIPDKDSFQIYHTRYVREPERYVEVTFTQLLDDTQELEGLAQLENTQATVSLLGNKLRLYPGEYEGALHVSLKAGIRSMNGQTLAADNTFDLEANEGLPAVRFVNNGVILPETDELQVPFQAIGLRGVIVRVLKIGEQNMGAFLQTNQLDGTGELMRVGRILTRQLIFFDEQQYDLHKWNTFALDLNQLIQCEPGAIYRVILSFDPDLSLYACGKEPKSQEELLQENQAKLEAELTKFDEGGWFYQEGEELDWSLYKYKERNDPCSPSYYFNKSVGKNLLATNIGLIAMGGDNGRLEVLARDLTSTEPIKNVRIQAYNYQQQLLAEEETDASGRATLDFTLSGRQPFYLLATQGKQRSYLRVDEGSALSLSTFDVDGEVVQKGLKGFIYGERGVWRPGDTLHLSCMLYDREKTLPAVHPVKIFIYNPLGQLYAQQTTTRGIQGLYTFHIPTENHVPTGAWRARVEVGGTAFEKRFRLESIKPNRLKISLQVPQTITRGEALQIPLHVEWLQGAKAKNLKYDVKGTFVATPTEFKGYETYTFDNPAQTYSTEESQLITGQTDANGDALVQARLQVGEGAPGMLLGSLTTKVYEESGDFSIDAAWLLYSPYRQYVGIHSPQKGEKALPTDKEVIYHLVSLDSQGKTMANTTINVSIYKLDWYWWWNGDANALARYVSNTYNRPIKQFTLKTDAQGKTTFPFKVPRADWGIYIILAKDAQGEHTTGIQSYFDWPEVEGRRDLSGSETASVLTFRTDRESYEPGEDIQVTIPSNADSRAIVSIQTGSKVLSIADYPCGDKETHLSIPVTEEMAPNAYLFISLLQKRESSQQGNDLPIRLYGVVPFEVNSEASHLHPHIDAPAEWKPEGRCELTVSEDSGREMAYTLAIVDEGLLDLTHFTTPDPWNTFHAREALGVRTWDLYNYVIGAYGGRIEQLFSIGGDAALNKGPKAIVNRFAPVVKFMGPFSLKKGEHKKHVFEMPNYNGRVRIMVVATDGSAFGSTEKSVPVRKPVMLLGTLPRMLGVNEEVDITATVFATERNVGNVQVSITTSPDLDVIGSSTKTLSFTEAEDKSLHFRVRAGHQPGNSWITLKATGQGEISTYSSELQLRSVSTLQKKNDNATLQPGESWKKAISTVGIKGSNSLSLEVARMKPLNLSARLAELRNYPHGCLEQTISRAFPLLYLPELVERNPEEMQQDEALVKQVIQQIRSYQTASGAFAYWQGQTSTHAYATVYALHFLMEAAAHGYAIPESLKTSALTDVRRTAANWKLPAQPALQASERYTQAYRLYVLALAGQADVGAMNRLKTIDLSLPDRWMLALAYAQVGRPDVASNLLKETHEVKLSAQDYTDTFGSSLRDEAIHLQLLCQLRQGEEAMPIAQEIAARLSSDEWMSTHEIAFALQSMAHYYITYPAGEGDMQFSYECLDENAQISTSKNTWQATWRDESQSFPTQLSLKNEGRTTLFVHAVQTGEVSQEEIEPHAGRAPLSIQYQTLDDAPLDVATLAQGTNFSAYLTIQNPTGQPLTHLALTQLIPSGWEVLNTRFLPGAFTASSVVSYQDIRDDRVLSYIDVLPAGGRVTIRVDLCATYAGRFYLPPTVCEGMYDSTLQSNTAGRWIEVK